MSKRILIFGVGELQKSIIEISKGRGFTVVGIDPDPFACCRKLVDIFEVVEGDNYIKTLEIARKYQISGIVTAATDKPLVMMARVAKELDLSFFSVETSINSTDKYLMKKQFEKHMVPCARGFLVSTQKILNDIEFPCIIKPRDNSGSRGVFLCKSLSDYKQRIIETKLFTKNRNVLVEDYIEGREYSIESIHFSGKTKIIQCTEKITTNFPFNVELGHIQPANLAESQIIQIKNIINKISKSLQFKNCVSHTELKINDKGIYVIESSPRLGGDYITSKLVPLSTGLNMENLLLDISLGENLKEFRFTQTKTSFSANFYIILESGKVDKIDDRLKEQILSIHGVIDYNLTIEEGSIVPKITNSLERYGNIIIQANTRDDILNIFNQALVCIKKGIKIV